MMRHSPIFLWETPLGVSCDPNFSSGSLLCTLLVYYNRFLVRYVSSYTHHVITATGVPNAQPDVALVVDRRGVGKLVRLEKEEEEETKA